MEVLAKGFIKLYSTKLMPNPRRRSPRTPLPIDVLELILDYYSLDEDDERRTMLALSLVCKSFAAVVQSRPWKNLVIDYWKTLDLMTRSTGKYPTKKLHVKQLWPGNLTSDAMVASEYRNIEPVLLRVLSRLHGVEEITFEHVRPVEMPIFAMASLALVRKVTLVHCGHYLSSDPKTGRFIMLPASFRPRILRVFNATFGPGLMLALYGNMLLEVEVLQIHVAKTPMGFWTYSAFPAFINMASIVRQSPGWKVRVLEIGTGYFPFEIYQDLFTSLETLFITSWPSNRSPDFSFFEHLPITLEYLLIDGKAIELEDRTRFGEPPIRTDVVFSYMRDKFSNDAKEAFISGKLPHLKVIAFKNATFVEECMPQLVTDLRDACAGFDVHVTERLTEEEITAYGMEPSFEIWYR